MMCVPIVSLYCDMHSLTMQRQKFTIIPDIMVTGFLSAVDSETGNPHLEARFTDADLTRKIIELNVLGGCTFMPPHFPHHNTDTNQGRIELFDKQSSV